MTDMVSSLTYAYLQIGVTGLIIVCLAVYFFYWMTKGKRRAEDAKMKQVEQDAKLGKIIENNTAALNLCTEVVKEIASQRDTEIQYLQRLDQRLTRHGDQHDEMLRNQAVAMDRQK